MNNFKRSLSIHSKIIIIGAGCAGIAAATRLLENGFSDITILEAENRIGGRIHSVDFGGSIVDLGAQWCHGDINNIVYDLVKDLNLLSQSYNDYRDNTYYLSDGTILNKQITDRIFRLVEEIWFVEDLDPAIKAGTYGDYFLKRYNEKVRKEFGNDAEALRIAGILTDWFHKLLNNLNATANWHEISPNEYYEECEGHRTWNWKNKGFRTILYVLMKKIPDITRQLPIDDKLFLNKEVTRIIWDNNTINENGVTVECSDGSSYNADHVIVTVSLGVLKKFYRNFTPQLPLKKQLAIENLGFGAVAKVLLKFTQKWWPNDLKGFSLVWDEDDRKQIVEEFPHGPIKAGRSWLEDIFGFYVIDSHPRILLGWIVGEMIEEIEQLPDNIVQDGCMFLLKKFAGRRYQITEPDAILRSKWKIDPHFLGTYSYISLEAEKTKVINDDLAQPLVSSSSKQTVLFAGEATHSKYFSTVHGAIETGFREADRIVNIYKSQPI